MVEHVLDGQPQSVLFSCCQSLCACIRQNMADATPNQPFGGTQGQHQGPWGMYLKGTQGKALKIVTRRKPLQCHYLFYSASFTRRPSLAPLAPHGGVSEPSQNHGAGDCWGTPPLAKASLLITNHTKSITLIASLPSNRHPMPTPSN